MIWQRSKVKRSCGSCSKPIAVGDPVLHVTDAYLSRCVECAKATYATSPPDTLEPLPKVDAPQKQPFAAARDLVRDYKLAQAGDDDAPAITDRIASIAHGKVLR